MENTHRKSGGEGPIPILIYTGGSIKSRPSSAGRSLPAPHRCPAHSAEMEAPADGPGGRPQEVPRGGWRGVGSTPGPRRRQWWPWPSWGLGSIRYGSRGGLGRAGRGQSGVSAPSSRGPQRLLAACTCASSGLGCLPSPRPPCWRHPHCSEDDKASWPRAPTDGWPGLCGGLACPTPTLAPGRPGSGCDPWKERAPAAGILPWHPSFCPHRAWLSS